MPKGTGKLYSKIDGTTYYFCSKKCEKNQLKLKRNPVRVKWTNAYHKVKESRIATVKKGKTKAEESEKK